MAIVIKDAPPPGWYLPVGRDGQNCAPFLWTGITRARGREVEGFTVAIVRCESGSRVHPEWRSSRKIVFLGDDKFYALVPVLPDAWRGQDIRAAAERAEQAAERCRASPTV